MVRQKTPTVGKAGAQIHDFHSEQAQYAQNLQQGQDKEYIRHLLSVAAALGHYGYDAPEEGRMSCPFCSGGSNKNNAILDWTRIYCFSCNASLDCFGVVEECEGVSFLEAVTIAADIAGLTGKTPPTTEEAEQRRAAAIARREEQAAQKAELQAAAAKTAQDLWDSTKDFAGDSLYLEKKKVKAFGLRLWGGYLLVPVYDVNGEIVSLQKICKDTGKKLFVTHGKTRDCFFLIGDPEKGSTVYISEGYATGASVHMATGGHAVFVAFNAGNLLSVAKIVKDKYPTREIVICADNDIHPVWERKKNTGVDAATIAARAIDTKLAIPELGEKKCDFNDVHVKRGLKTVKEQLEAAQFPPPIIHKAIEVPPSPPEAPLPLRKEPQPQEAYPVASFGVFAEAVEVFAYATKTPVTMAANGVLSALSLGAQAIANVETQDGRSIPLSLYALTVAESGDRKSALDNVVLYAVQQIEKQKYMQYQAERKAYDEAKLKWDALPKKQREVTPFAMHEPQNTAQIMENVNAEGAFRQLKEGSPSLAFFSNEAGTLFGGQAFTKDNMVKSVCFFSSLWDGKPIDKLRAGEGFSRLYNRRACAHFMLQPVLAEKILADELLQGQGFLPRFLIAWPQTLRGTRTYEPVNVRTHHAARAFYAACEQLLNTPPRINAEDGGLILDSLCLSNEAHTLWVLHHDNVETMLAPERELAPVYAYASKNAEQALRIAGVLTLAEDRGARTITGEVMARAISLAQWYLKEALRLHQNGTTPPEILKAERLLEWIRTHGHKHVSLRLIQNSGAAGLDLKAKAEPVVRVLEEHGYLKRDSGSVVIAGSNTKTFWEVCA